MSELRVAGMGGLRCLWGAPRTLLDKPGGLSRHMPWAVPVREVIVGTLSHVLPLSLGLPCDRFSVGIRPASLSMSTDRRH